MAVNSYLISELFSGDVAKKLVSSRYQYPIKYATIYNPLLRIKQDAVYLVVNPMEFPDDRSGVKSTFVVLGNLDKKVLNETHHDVICLHYECTLGKIYEMILDQIEQYSRWEETMNQVLLRGGTMDELCQSSLIFFNNPIFVASGDFKVLAVGQSPLHPFRKKLQSKNGYLCEQRILNLIYGLGSSDRNEDDIRFKEVCEEGCTTLRMTIESNQQVWGYVCLDDVSRPFTDGDYTRLCIMEQYISKYIELSPNMQNAAYHRFKNFLSEYLYSDRIAPTELQRMLSSMEWKVEDTYICCVLQMRQSKGKRYISNYLCGYIEHHSDGLVTVRRNDRIDILCNLNQMNLRWEKWLDYLDRLSTEFGISIGISTPFYDCTLLRDYFKQAEAAVTFCTMRNQSFGVYQFECCRLEYIMENGLNSLPLTALMTQELKEFLDADAENSYENYKIFRCYIRNNLSISDTIGELYLHRSSFIYRLDKIKKMMHSNFEERDEQLYLRLMTYAIDKRYLEKKIDIPENAASLSRIRSDQKAS